ncbi:glycosyltransferase [Asticcacaulis sp.]|uniref:glycosyltransferase n=1 Tax=Asticcacaulis sp. TaxID=1872648 RepID=UPI0039191A08
MRVVRVETAPPRTKPRALNFALQRARGDLVAIYDAEDIPVPRQLREAAAHFASLPARVACLQAPCAPQGHAASSPVSSPPNTPCNSTCFCRPCTGRA